MIKVLNKTQNIRKQKCEVQISEIQEGHHYVCHVICTGESLCYKWHQTFRSIYGGYAILMEKNLIDLPGKRFLVCQVNEHSKGGHLEYEIYLLDLNGKILNQFTGSYNSKVLLDDNFIWFYVSGDRPYSYSFNLDLKLIKLNYLTGIAKTITKGQSPLNIGKHFWNE